MKEWINNQRRSFLIFVIVIFIFIAFFSGLLLIISFDEDYVPTKEDLRVVDGDTFILSNGQTIRLLCVNAPEKGTQGYEEAKDYLFSLVYNKSLVLESDMEQRDKYDRLLMYVYADGVFVNKELVKRGHAVVYRYGNSTAKCGEIESA